MPAGLVGRGVGWPSTNASAICQALSSKKVRFLFYFSHVPISCGQRSQGNRKQTCRKTRRSADIASITRRVVWSWGKFMCRCRATVWRAWFWVADWSRAVFSVFFPLSDSGCCRLASSCSPMICPQCGGPDGAWLCGGAANAVERADCVSIRCECRTTPTGRLFQSGTSLFLGIVIRCWKSEREKRTIIETSPLASSVVSV